MKRLPILYALGLILAASLTAFGDIARPRPEPSQPPDPKHVMYTNLEIVPDLKTGRTARLQLSESMIKELREALNAGTTNPSFSQRVARSPTNTIVAGVLLFLSVSFAGIWLVRSSKSAHSRGQKFAAGVLVGIATLGAAAIITQANAGPPPSYLWRNLSKNLNTGKPTTGGIVIEIVPGPVGAKLIVPITNTVRTDD